MSKRKSLSAVEDSSKKIAKVSSPDAKNKIKEERAAAKRYIEENSNTDKGKVSYGGGIFSPPPKPDTKPAKRQAAAKVAGSNKKAKVAPPSPESSSEPPTPPKPVVTTVEKPSKAKPEKNKAPKIKKDVDSIATTGIFPVATSPSPQTAAATAPTNSTTAMKPKPEKPKLDPKLAELLSRVPSASPVKSTPKIPSTSSESKKDPRRQSAHLSELDLKELPKTPESAKAVVFLGVGTIAAFHVAFTLSALGLATYVNPEVGLMAIGIAILGGVVLRAQKYIFGDSEN